MPGVARRIATIPPHKKPSIRLPGETHDRERGNISPPASRPRLNGKGSEIHLPTHQRAYSSASPPRGTQRTIASAVSFPSAGESGRQQRGEISLVGCLVLQQSNNHPTLPIRVHRLVKRDAGKMRRSLVVRAAATHFRGAEFSRHDFGRLIESHPPTPYLYMCQKYVKNLSKTNETIVQKATQFICQNVPCDSLEKLIVK